MFKNVEVFFVNRHMEPMFWFFCLMLVFPIRPQLSPRTADDSQPHACGVTGISRAFSLSVFFPPLDLGWDFCASRVPSSARPVQRFLKRTKYQQDYSIQGTVIGSLVKYWIKILNYMDLSRCWRVISLDLTYFTIIRFYSELGKGGGGDGGKEKPGICSELDILPVIYSNWNWIVVALSNAKHNQNRAFAFGIHLHTIKTDICRERVTRITASPFK